MSGIRTQGTYRQGAATLLALCAFAIAVLFSGQAGASIGSFPAVQLIEPGKSSQEAPTELSAPSSNLPLDIVSASIDDAEGSASLQGVSQLGVSRLRPQPREIARWHPPTSTSAARGPPAS